MYGGPPPPHNGYNYPMPANMQAHFNNGGGNGPGGYGPVYYNMPQSANFASAGLTESRKRHHDMLDQFFGDAKRRQIDASQYMDLGAQFGGVQNLPLTTGYDGGAGGGFGGGYGGPAIRGDDETGGPATMSMPAGHGFGMPFNNVKTRNDLMSIDQFLLQLQTTVYEHSGGAQARPAATNDLNSGIDPGLRDSPPNSVPGMAHTDSTASSIIDTPGLTPGSSHISSHSPASVHSQTQRDYPPTSRAGYPTLPPSVHAMGSDIGQQQGQYNLQHHNIPPAGVSNPYEDLEARRRYSGGYLQRAQPATPHSPNSAGSENADSDSKTIKSEAGDKDRMPPPSQHPEREGSTGSASSDEKLEAWVQNMRVIEALRRFVQGRLQKGEFVEDGQEGTGSGQEEAMQQDGSGTLTPKQEHAAPQAQMVSEGLPRDQDHEMQDLGDDVKGKAVEYPTLRTTQQTA